ncbi:hypothetical protein ACO0QE_003355 [Hanseniaspora vineae]
MSVVAISVEETNRIRQYFGLKLLPVINSGNSHHKTKNHGPKQRQNITKSDSEPFGNYHASSFIDTSLFKKHKQKSRNNEINLDQISIDDDGNDVANSSAWLEKLGEKETQMAAAAESEPVKKDNAKIKSYLANNIIMTLKEQDILEEQSDFPNPKDSLTVEKEFETKNFADFSQNSLLTKRKTDSKHNDEVQAAKKNKKVKIEGKVRVSLGNHDNAPQHEQSDHMPIKIKKRKAKKLSQKPRSSLPHFEIQKVDLIDEDDPEEDNGALDDIIRANRLQKLPSAKKARGKDSPATAHIEHSSLNNVQYEDHSDFLDSLKAPVLETGGLGHSDAAVNTQNVSSASIDEKNTATHIAIEEPVSTEPNFFDGLASTLQFLNNNLSSASNSPYTSHISFSIPSANNPDTPNSAFRATASTTTEENKQAFSINLKYTDDVTGEELNPKKAFRQFNKNFYKAKKNSRSAKPK